MFAKQTKTMIPPVVLFIFQIVSLELSVEGVDDTSSDNGTSPRDTERITKQVYFSCDEMSNSGQGWFPLDFGSDGRRKAGVCFHVPTSDTFNWNDANSYCSNLNFPGGTESAHLVKLTSSEIIESFLPRKKSKGDVTGPILTIPVDAYAVLLADGEPTFRWNNADNSTAKTDASLKYTIDFSHYDPAVDDIKNFRGFLEVNLTAAGTTDYTPKLIAYREGTSAVTPSATETTLTTTSAAATMRSTMVNRLTNSNTSAVEQTQRKANISLVLCMATLKEEVCPFSQLLSPFKYNRYLGTLRGVHSDATVYSPQRVDISDFLFSKPKMTASSSLFVEYNATGPKGTFNDHHPDLTPVSPFDLVMYSCAIHFYIEEKHMTTERPLNQSRPTKSSICHANLTLSDSIRQKFCIPTDFCRLLPCLYGGTCKNVPENERIPGEHPFTCRCKVPHFGKRCELTSCTVPPIEKTDKFWVNIPNETDVVSRKDYCVHGGCTGDEEQPCTCLFSGGPRCAFDFDDCVHHDCKNDAICIDQRLHNVCVCKEGYFGHHCEETHNLCASKPCLNGGSCLITHSSYRCYCVGKWSGRHCENSPEVKKQAAIGGVLAVSCAVIFFFTACCMCLTRLRQKDKPYAKTDRMGEDIALLFELADKKYGAINLEAQEHFVDFIYNQTQVIQEVDAAMAKAAEEKEAATRAATTDVHFNYDQ